MMERASTRLDGIWERLSCGEPLCEQDFLAVAFWAFHTMPAESVNVAAFRLFEYAQTCRLARQ